jgi:hypothetical protein
MRCICDEGGLANRRAGYIDNNQVQISAKIGRSTRLIEVDWQTYYLRQIDDKLPTSSIPTITPGCSILPQEDRRARQLP